MVPAGFRLLWRISVASLQGLSSLTARQIPRCLLALSKSALTAHRKTWCVQNCDVWIEMIPI